MVEVLEHVSDPDALLKEARHWLRPDGLLYLTTPNAESLNRRCLGSSWSIFSPPEHLVIWSPRGLQHALARNSFQMREIRTEGFNPSEILQRLQSKSSSVAPSRNDTGAALNERLSSSPFRRKVKAAINQCLSLFRVGDSLKAWAIRS
jgi:SAM-dependent methyltransferase